jgi:hypothetical protein
MIAADNRAHSVGAQIIRALLPLGGLMASLVEMYADESYGGDETTGPLCLAMYLYEHDQGVLATDEWVRVLNDPDLPRPLPFFRMSDCAHAQGVFEGMEDHCDRIARKMIPIPRSRSIVGFAATVDQGDFAKIMPASAGYKNPYTFLAQMCLGFIQEWIKKNDYSGSILYNFEDGHKHKPDVDRIMEEVKTGKSPIRAASYGGHAFVPKVKMPLLQSADLLAWHSFTDFKRRARGERMRRDYKALARRGVDKVQRWTAEQLEIAVPHVQEYEQLTKVINALENEIRQRRRLRRGRS